MQQELYQAHVDGECWTVAVIRVKSSSLLSDESLQNRPAVILTTINKGDEVPVVQHTITL